MLIVASPMTVAACPLHPFEPLMSLHWTTGTVNLCWSLHKTQHWTVWRKLFSAPFCNSIGLPTATSTPPFPPHTCGSKAANVLELADPVPRLVQHAAWPPVGVTCARRGWSLHCCPGCPSVR